MYSDLVVVRAADHELFLAVAPFISISLYLVSIGAGCHPAVLLASGRVEIHNKEKRKYLYTYLIMMQIRPEPQMNSNASRNRS